MRPLTSWYSFEVFFKLCVVCLHWKAEWSSSLGVHTESDPEVTRNFPEKPSSIAERLKLHTAAPPATLFSGVVNVPYKTSSSSKYCTD